MRIVGRVVVALVAIVVLYFGQYWARRIGGGCSPSDDDRLAVVGIVIVGAGSVALVLATVDRLAVGVVAAAIGVVLVVIGLGIAVGCLA